MLRYFSIIWNSASSTASGEAERVISRFKALPGIWQQVVHLEGLTVFYADGYRTTTTPKRIPRPCHLLHDLQGVILGDLFPRRPTHPQPEFAILSESDSRTIVASKGKHLIEEYWGRYVAFFLDAETHSTYALRDPTGGIPCYRVRARGVTVIFSALEDCLSAGLGPFAPNFQYLAARACVSWRLEARETALLGVANLIAGECTEWNHTTATTLIQWHPARHAQTDDLDDHTLARNTLRESCRQCVHAWADYHSNILIRLSGGFDSSLLSTLTATASSKPMITCINHYSAGIVSDERPYAREVAARAGLNLIERERDSFVSLRGILEVRPSPSPILLVQALEASYMEIPIAERIGATALFGGQLGDQLFYHNPIGLSAADHIFRHGPSRRAFSISLACAFTEHTSVWRFLYQAVRFGFLRKPYDLTGERLRVRKLVPLVLLTDPELLKRFAHPWLDSLSSVPPGKASQIASLKDPIEYYDPICPPGPIDYVFPYNSQPLIETSLRIPTYILTTGGTDRALARQAFADLLPRDVTQRHWKGEMEEHYSQMIRSNLPFMREIMLGGALVKEGIVDKMKLEDTLNEGPSNIQATTAELFDLLSIEAWLLSIRRSQNTSPPG